MKFIAILFASIALVSFTAMPSCTGVFSKQDAAAIGAQLAQDSLALASQELTGQPVNLKAGAAQIGLKTFANVMAKVQSNVSGTATTPAAVLSQAAQIAQDQIAAKAADSPQLAAAAQVHAATAVSTAEVQIAATVPNGAAAPEPGK